MLRSRRVLRALPRLAAATVVAAGSLGAFAIAHASGERKPPTSSETKLTSNDGKVAELAENKMLVPRFVQVVHRHGARTPISLVHGQTQEDFDKLWSGWCKSCELEDVKCEMGDLTLLGKTQMELVGAKLRARYQGTGLLPDFFDPESVLVRTTAMNRTLMSVSHLVRAMFPGTTQNDVNLHVHIRKLRDESLWPEPRACDRLRELLWLNKKSADFLAYQNQPHLLNHRAHLAKHLEVPTPDLPSWIILVDPVKCMKAHDLPLPACWNSKVYEDGEAAAGYTFGKVLGGDETVKTGLGRFVHELLAQQDRKLAPGTPDSKLKFAFYSGHDTTLVPLMHALRIWNHEWPPFASWLAFELLEEIDAPPGAVAEPKSVTTTSTTTTHAGSKTVKTTVRTTTTTTVSDSNPAAVAAAAAAAASHGHSHSKRSGHHASDAAAVVVVPAASPLPCVGDHCPKPATRIDTAPAAVIARKTGKAAPGDDAGSAPAAQAAAAAAPARVAVAPATTDSKHARPVVVAPGAVASSPSAGAAAAASGSGQYWVRVLFNDDEKLLLPLGQFREHLRPFAIDDEQYPLACRQLSSGEVPPHRW